MLSFDYKQGSLRYLFFHGNHGDAPYPPHLEIEASIVIFTGEGQVLDGGDFKNLTSRYHFINGNYEALDGSDREPLPAKPLVERLLKNVSVPSLVLAEVARDQMGKELNAPDPFFWIAILVLGRSDLRPCTVSDREYLTLMLHAFVPRFVGSLAPVACEYLPGDARNLSSQLAGRIQEHEDSPEFSTFISMYRSRYVQKPLERKDVLELYLLHIVKMPFELGLSVRNSLIRY
ncbi:hypothetical protein BJY04DRAFT_12132 [Aspergillus karnatakaensis]|uniref:uncharacterized protein n=1 Tax=Aspergillus karnatakaensis TaxID=1810916 RepID=UPI003CCD52F1